MKGDSNELDSPSEALEENHKQPLVPQTPVDNLEITEKRPERTASDDLLLAELEAMSDYK